MGRLINFIQLTYNYHMFQGLLATLGTFISPEVIINFVQITYNYHIDIYNEKTHLVNKAKNTISRTHTVDKNRIPNNNKEIPSHLTT